MGFRKPPSLGSSLVSPFESLADRTPALTHGEDLHGSSALGALHGDEPRRR